MNSLPSYPDTKINPEEQDPYYPMDEKKQPQPSTSSMDLYDVGSSTEEKKLPPPPPPPPMHSLPPPLQPPPVQIMAELLPMQQQTRPLRRRRCLLGWLCVTLVIVIAAVFVFVIYGIPASRCCSCLIAYDKCNNGLASTDTAGQKACLDRFYSCSASSFYVFFDCNDRLYHDRHLSCWIQYFDD